jgi:Fe-S-cluster-containing hydrogenase component 2
MKRNLFIVVIAMLALYVASCTDSVDKISVSGNTNKELAGANVVIDANVCYGCIYEYCYRRCPVKAVSKTKIENRTYYIIDPEKCIKCGICIESCPFDAITWKQ